MERVKGFTLIELMIAVVVVSILAAIALPAYTNYVKRGKISEATTNLSGLRVSMEQYYQDNRTYQNAAGTACGVAMPTSPTVKYFSFGCTAPTSDTYTITATGQASGGMANFVYKIDQANNKTTTSLPADWNLPPGGISCWATKSGGSC